MPRDDRSLQIRKFMARNWKHILSNLKGALMRRGLTVHDAEDLVQEAWVRLAMFESREVVVEPEAFLMRAALNLSTDAYRTRASRGEQLMLEDVVLVDATPSGEAKVMAQQQLARLSECLAALPCRTRDIFLAHRHDGLRYADIAALCGLSVSAVEKHIARAMLEVSSGMEGWYP
jgi:RNA polymerase sigma factor (sigma-70 family)